MKFYKILFQYCYILLIFCLGFVTNLGATQQNEGIKNAGKYFSCSFPKQFQVLDSLIDSLSTKKPELATATLHQMEIAAKQNGGEARIQTMTLPTSSRDALKPVFR